MKFTYDRYLTEKGNPHQVHARPRGPGRGRRPLHRPVPPQGTFRLAPAHARPTPLGTWIVAREIVEKYGDLKKAETAIGTGPFVLERYEPNVKAVFRRNPDYFRPGLP